MAHPAIPNDPAPNANTLWARSLLDELARCGVRHLVVAPGSRSTPLVLAAAGDPRFQMIAQVDERAAGFLALGVGKGTGVPAAVITTSGTAVANLLPAVVEAAQSETPLLILSADRPPHLRGADANQAIDQVHLFGRYPRFFRELSPYPVTPATLRHLRQVACEAVAHAVGAPAGPVHLNLPFTKPLEPVPVAGEGVEAVAAEAGGRGGGLPLTRIHRTAAFPEADALAELREMLTQAERPLLLAGPAPEPERSGPALLALARHLGIPLLADPLSGARTREHAGYAYDLALRVPAVREALRPDLILRVGQTPSSAPLSSWMESLRGIPHILVDGGGRWKDHLGVATTMIPADPARLAKALMEGPSVAAGVSAPRDASEWLAQWQRVDAQVGTVLSGWMASGDDASAEPAAAVLAAQLAASDQDGILFVSNSMPIRDVDAYWPAGAPADTAEPTLILGNRGASGIDGIVSTALGTAWGTGRPVTLLLGDLALLHDQNGFLARSALERIGVSVHVLVVNNDGGGIFDHLPASAYDPPFTEFIITPHGRDLSHLAALYALPYRVIRGGDAAALKTALQEVRGVAGVTLTEFQTPRGVRPTGRARLEMALTEALPQVLPPVLTRPIPAP